MLRLKKLLERKAGGGLEKIIQRAQNMGDLVQRLRAELPPELGEQLLAANIRDDGELVMVCRSSAWAARLRFEGDRLVAVARASGETVSRYRVKVGA